MVCFMKMGSLGRFGRGAREDALSQSREITTTAQHVAASSALGVSDSTSRYSNAEVVVTLNPSRARVSAVKASAVDSMGDHFNLRAFFERTYAAKRKYSTPSTHANFNAVRRWDRTAPEVIAQRTSVHWWSVALMHVSR